MAHVALRLPVPIWFCSGWGLPCHACYQTCGALLPHLFTLTGKPAVCSLWHYPSDHSGRALPAILPCGARTFLERFRPQPSGPLVRASYNNLSRLSSLAAQALPASALSLQHYFATIRQLLQAGASKTSFTIRLASADTGAVFKKRIRMPLLGLAGERWRMSKASA